MVATLDINADMAEGFGRWTLGDDASLLEVVTSANIACGFHAGDPMTVWRALPAAKSRHVAVGAHVSYRDLAGFGRRFLDASRSELTADIIYQLGALDGLARAAGTKVRYVKPHGALYSTVARGGEHADALVDAVRLFDPALPVVTLAGSALWKQLADAGLAPIAEAFADRAYRSDGTLVPRGEPGAVISEPAAVRRRVEELLELGRIRSIDGLELPVAADTVCVHSDTSGAGEVARVIRTVLDELGVLPDPFTGAR